MSKDNEVFADCPEKEHPQYNIDTKAGGNCNFVENVMLLLEVSGSDIAQD